VEKGVIYHTDGIGADAVVIYAATPSNKLVNQAARMARKKGRIVVVGDVGLTIDRALFYEKELDLLISRSYGPGRYDQLYEKKGMDYPIEYVRWTENRNMQAFLELLKEKKIDMKPLLDAVAIFPIEEAENAYKLLITSEKKPLGVLIKYNPSKYFSPTGEVTLHKRVFEVTPKAVEGKINVAVIGTGNFARNILLPLLSKIHEYNLKAIVDVSGSKAKQVAAKYNADYCTTDYKEILEDAGVDLVVITTPHNLHYPMIIDAAKAGKAIYVEKPMCLNERELKYIVKVISETKVPLIVGFNRRYAPLVVKAKELIKQMHRPYLVNYRVNAEFIPKTHWVQDPEIGGGRVIGECCHFFDIFNYFIESDVKSIGAESIPVGGTAVVAQDNIVATIAWSDGSLATLTYTTLGHHELPKERIEIFVGGKSLVIDDFVEMKLYGFKEKSIRLRKQDKGHFQELIEIAKLLKGEKSNAISFGESVKAMEITFKVEKSLLKSCHGKS
jgi:predicted dehydrogenase